MSISQTSERTSPKPLRLWPGVVVVVLQWLAWFVLPLLNPEAMVYGVFAGIGGGLIIALWWLFFSRAPWVDRIGALALMPLAVLATKRVVHPSIANGMMGMMLPIYSIPVLSIALVAWAVATRRVSSGPRRVALVASILVACAVFTLVRTGGITGDANSDLHWRWTPTPEERLLAQVRDEPAPPAPAPAAPAAPEQPRAAASAPEPEPPAPAKTAAGASKKAVADAKTNESVKHASVSAAPEPEAEWPGFRGPHRDSVVPGILIETDWSKSAPAELWRRPIGPGWSSFAVQGHLFYTQEQRGDEELVSCYDMATGKPVWRHRDPARFWESNGGAGPRGTPAVHHGRVYGLGATGILNALDGRTGAVLWSRNAAADTGAKLPGWGFAGSPLVVNDVVYVATSGRLAAYDAVSGQPRWFRQTDGGGYSSPHFTTIDGVAQIVLLSGGGATGVALTDGAILWQHKWQEGVSIVQPALMGNGDILISGGDAMGAIGIRRITVAHGSGGWTATERWTTTGLKPYFNDFVIHKGHAFGFDGSILACIGLEDGARKWKGGRYGHGQLVLLPEQDLLLVLSEEGELALVRATPDQFTEVARFKAIEGKTWNHPVLVGDVLLVRNGEEMTAFRLTRVGS